MSKVRHIRLIGLLSIAAIIWSVLALLSDSKDIFASIRHISPFKMIIVLLLSAANYYFRIVRFNWFSKKVAQRPIRSDMNAMIFLSGLSMNLTPARVGEVIKAYFQRQFFGESFARMAPIVFCERLTDSLAMLLLMSVGVLTFRMGFWMFLILASIVLVVMFLLHRRDLAKKVIPIVEKFPLGKKFSSPLRRALSASYELTAISSMSYGTFLGVIAWALEASGLWVLIGALGIPMTLSTLYHTLFIFSVSAAAGFISIIPAGLGINELSTIGLLEQLIGMPYSAALVATFAFRLVTLWFGVLLGLVSVTYLEKKAGTWIK